MDNKNSTNDDFNFDDLLDDNSVGFDDEKLVSKQGEALNEDEVSLNEDSATLNENNEYNEDAASLNENETQFDDGQEETENIVIGDIDEETENKDEIDLQSEDEIDLQSEDEMDLQSEDEIEFENTDGEVKNINEIASENIETERENIDEIEDSIIEEGLEDEVKTEIVEGKQEGEILEGEIIDGKDEKDKQELKESDSETSLDKEQGADMTSDKQDDLEKNYDEDFSDAHIDDEVHGDYEQDEAYNEKDEVQGEAHDDDNNESHDDEHDEVYNDENNEDSNRTKRASLKKASKQSVSTDSGDDGDGIILKNIGTVMHESMIPYSEFVIMDRALPRVEDGLKPVQRRILYAMHDMGLLPDRPFRKSAGIVGECLGKYHPHGDTSVYDAMVRLAQPFNMNMPLVIGQGNFGSDDGDPAAAMRYTEAKLSPLALELLRDIDKDTVPFSLTFDDRNQEPDILPGRYPNLLTNGATGIAVGLATNIPPHNLAEVIDAHIAYIDNNKITLAQVMKIIKGPDFPSGGFVLCGDDLVSAYKGGKGRVVMRAKIHIEVEAGDRRNIVITELPYQVNKVHLQRAIADLRESKKGVLSGISEIRDESDRNGMRIVIKIKREFDAKEICALLFKHTNLQCNYNINIVAIANGKPRSMGLLEIISYYVEFQREVIYKRSVFDLENARERAHILEGLLIAIRAIDEVVKIIKTSKTTSEAKERLKSTFQLSDRQAQAILDLRLARLTSLEVYKLEQELAELKKLIEKLSAIIASKKLQFEVVKQELLEIKKRHKVERRSRIIRNIEDAVITADDDEKPVEDVVITLTADGTVKRMPAKHFSMSKTEFGSLSSLSDINIVVIATQTDKLLYFFTNIGNCYKIDAGDIPECKLRDRGIGFAELCKEIEEKEVPIAVYAQTCDIVELDSKDELGELVWLTQAGHIKRSTWSEGLSIQKTNFQCYKSSRSDGDMVLRVDELRPKSTIMLVNSSGYVLNALTSDVPQQGRIAGGVKGISMADTDKCVCNCVCKQNGFVVAVNNKGGVKKTPVKDIEKMVRYRKGLQFGAVSGDEKIVFAACVKDEDDLVIEGEGGKLVALPIQSIKSSDRTTKFKNVSAFKGKAVNAYIHRRKKNN